MCLELYMLAKYKPEFKPFGKQQSSKVPAVLPGSEVILCGIVSRLAFKFLPGLLSMFFSYNYS